MSEQPKDTDESTPSRRDFLKVGSAVMAGALGAQQAGCAPLFASKGKPFTGEPKRYDVIIVGSGFGATVAATELMAKCPSAKLLIIERGVFFTSPERPIPDYLRPPERRVLYQYWPRPDNASGFQNDFLKLVRLNAGTSFRSQAAKVPLYHYSQFDDVDIVTAGGVGGGSLIYSNVSLEPFFDESTQRYPVMKDWPFQLAKPDYDRARGWMTQRRGVPSPIVTTVPLDDQLKPQVTHLEKARRTPSGPEENLDYLYLPRSRALKRASEHVTGSWTMRESWRPLDLQLFEHDGTPAATLVDQRFCERQGRCFLGCLPGARHTLNKTLLRDVIGKPTVTLSALSHVQQVRAHNSGYEVIHHDVLTGDETRSWAPIVILAAGVLGSTEILLRSRDMPLEGAGKLSVSSTLGAGFSTNGDFSAFVRNIPIELKNSAGKFVDNRVLPTRGPINTSHVTFQDGNLFINVEDAGIPAMFAALTRNIVDAMNAGGTVSFGRLISDALSMPTRGQTEPEMIEDLFWFNCMGTDGMPGRPFQESAGRFSLTGSGKLTLAYANGSSPVNHPVFAKVEEILRGFAVAMQGQYVSFPLWGGLFGRRKLVVTHPLGGCPMGRSSSEGVVNPNGQVFNTASGSESVHPGLFVMDGSMLPGPVAVNPTLTIVAVALRVSDAVKQHMASVTPAVTCA